MIHNVSSFSGLLRAQVLLSLATKSASRYSVFTWRHVGHVDVPKQRNRSQLIITELNSLLMQMISFALIEKHSHWSCEWKHYVPWYAARWYIPADYYFKMKIRREVLTLSCNWSSLEICGALWDNYAYFLLTYWSAVTFKTSYSDAN